MQWFLTCLQLASLFARKCPLDSGCREDSASTEIHAKLYDSKSKKQKRHATHIRSQLNYQNRPDDAKLPATFELILEILERQLVHLAPDVLLQEEGDSIIYSVSTKI